MENKRILYVSSELAPYLPSTAIADVSLEMPRIMQENSAEVRVFMPRYGNINERRHQLHEVIRLSGMNLAVNEIDQPLIIKVASIPKERLQVYFIDNDDYFKNKGLTGSEENNLYPDNDERMMFFAKGVLETVKKLNWSPDIIHICGWMSYALPMYVRTIYKDDPAYSDAKIVTSVFCDRFEGRLNPEFKNKLALDHIEEELLGEPDYVNLTKTSIKYSDGVIWMGDRIDEDIVSFAESCNLPHVKISAENCNYQSFADIYEKIFL